jgi:hypothetical protein
MWRRIAWAGVVVITLASAFVAYLFLYTSDELQFLAGKPLYGEPHEVPDNLGGGPPGFETSWAFKGEWTKFVAEAEEELFDKGWKKDEEASGPDTMGFEGGKLVFYYRKDKDTISLHQDAEPAVMVASDLVMVANPRKGYVGVTYYQHDFKAKKDTSWLTWFRDVLHLR